MKGHYTIEWLSQSSSGTGVPETRPPGGDPWPLTGPQGGPYTSSTPPESLPGYYGRRRQGSPQGRDMMLEKQPTYGHGSLNTMHQGLCTDNLASPHSNTQVTETDFNSSMEEEETSGYESEGGRSLSPATPQVTLASSPTTGRRPRTAFTVEQINHLERAFKRNAYLGTQDKAELCRKLNLSDKQIRNWFQNRRMKLKRTLQDALAQACQAKAAASQLMHYPDLHAFRSAPYPSYYPVHESPAAYPPAPSMPYAPTAAVPVDSAVYQCASMPSLVMPAGGAVLVPQYHPYHLQY